VIAECPNVDEFAFLPGIAAVDDALGTFNQFLYYVELSFFAALAHQLYAEFGRNHGQTAQAPALPHLCVVVGLLKRTQMAECPCYAVSVSFEKSVVRSYCA
jgi:hypothetical protein